MDAIWAAVVLAEDAPEPQQGGGNSIMMLVMLGVVAVAMIVMSRRNKKKQGDADAFRSQLAPGQRVMTMSGLVGVVSNVTGDVITVRGESGGESQWIRRAIRSVVSDEEWEAMTAEYPDEEEPTGEVDNPEGREGDEGSGDGEPGIQRF